MVRTQDAIDLFAKQVQFVLHLRLGLSTNLLQMRLAFRRDRVNLCFLRFVETELAREQPGQPIGALLGNRPICPLMSRRNGPT